MRNNWKKLTALVLTVACTLVLTMSTAFAAVSTPEYYPITEAEMQKMLETSIQVAQALAGADEATMENYALADDQFTARAAAAWTENKEQLGALVEIGDSKFEKEGEFITCTIPATFELNEGTIRVYWNADTSMPTDFTLTVEEKAGSLIKGAAMNTVVGIGVVFAMLVFLIFVISMFKYVSKIGQKKSAPAPVKQAPAPVAAAAVEEEATDDDEIQAVIAAAIAMYEEEMAAGSGDAYVARPINKKRNWKRA